MMSRPKGSNSLAFAKRVVKTWLMYSDGYNVERIAYDLGVTPRMVYYYLRAWYVNKDHFIKIAKEAGLISIRDEASFPSDKKVFTAKELIAYYEARKL